MRAPNDCKRCPHLNRTERDTTKVRRTQASNTIRCTRYELPAWDAIGGCRRSKDAAKDAAIQARKDNT